MAFTSISNALNGDDKNKDQTQPEGVQGAPIEVGPSAGGPLSNGLPSASNTAGSGGGWTNIQSYLTANEGASGSAKALEDRANSVLTNERETANSKANEVKNQASQNLQTQIGEDKASELIKQAGNQYNFQSPYQQNDQYGNAVNTLKTAYSGQYTAPTSFSYGLSNQAQDFGNLDSQAGFQNIMSQVYGDAAGKPLTGGQMTLQNQLDVNNKNLADARRSAANNFQGLQSDISGLVDTTNQNLSETQSEYLRKQNALKSYLSNQSDIQRQERAQAEANARSGYNQEFSSGASGRDNTFYGRDVAMDPSWYQERGVPIANNLTWKQLQDEQNFYNSGGYKAQGRGNYYYLDEIPNSQPVWTDAKNYFSGNTDALNQFYNDQTNKYAETGFQDRREFNAIMDALGLEERMSGDAFNVRGS